MSQTRTSSIQELNRILRQPDLSILGTSIANLPPAQWRARMLFMGVPDTDLRFKGVVPETCIKGGQL